MIAINGFIECGTTPLDLNVFGGSDFIAAVTTEIAVIDPPIAEYLRSETTEIVPIVENSRS